jgi:hypothetical protein
MHTADLRDERVVVGGAGAASAGEARSIEFGKTEKEAGQREKSEWGVGVNVVLVVVLLWWWMLLMTAAYFHTWLEKVCQLPDLPPDILDLC